MVFASFFTSLFNILLSTFMETIYGLCLSIDGIIYEILSYSFNLFLLMCQINLDYVVSLVGGLIDRLQAVVIVLIVFKMGVAIIQYLINPEDSIMKKGSDLIKNIFIAAALLISYNFIFGLVNDLSILVIGSSGGYNYNTLSQIVDVSPEADEGLIMRFIFGSDAKVDDIGDYISFQTLSMFVRGVNGEGDNTELAKTISDGDGYKFSKLSNITSKINKTVEYTPILCAFIGVYLIYSIVMCALKIGTRMFKLVILQILAPVAIISIIQDGVKGKTFSGYIKLYGSTVLDAFLRIASMLIVTVFVCKFFLSIDSFFASTTSTSGDWLTKALLTILVIIAGYKFANEIPAFINKALGTSLDEKGKDGLGKWISGAVGLGVGGAIGFATGITNKAGLGGALANMGLGMINGAGAGAKGNGIAETFKNMKDVTNKSNARAADFGNRGFGNVVAGGIQNAFGTGKSKDAQMRKLDAQQAALSAYDAAQVEEIKDYKVGGEGFNWNELEGADGSKHSAADLYTGGYDNIKLGDNKDAFSSSMLEFDKSYIDSKANYELALKSNDESKIRDASADLAASKQLALQRAGDVYDSNKNAAHGENVASKKASVDSSGASVVSREDGSINVKETGKEITRQKHSLENSRSYKQTHGAPKDK